MTAIEDQAAVIVNWLREQLKITGMNGYVLGLSGGVDSALAAQLITRAAPGRCVGVIMPADSNPQDRLDGIASAKAAELPYLEVDLTELRQRLDLDVQAALNGAGMGGGDDPMRRGNIGARLRMTTLYAVAGSRRALVVGTDNAAETYTGYFTKYGDGGVDLLPLAHLTKGEVRAMAAALGVPAQIVEKPPSAGFFAGQTDETEMGVDYQTIDNFLQGKPIDAAKKEKIEMLHRISEHKRQPLPRIELK